MASAAEEQNAATAEISHSIATAARGSRDASDYVAEMVRSIASTKDSSGDVEATANASSQLSGAVNNFLNGVEELSQAA